MVEERISMLKYRRSIVLAAALVALLSPRAADAQAVLAPSPNYPTGGLAKIYTPRLLPELANQKKAVRRLPIAQERLRRDTQLGDTAAVHRDMHRIDMLRYRISLDEWLILKNSNFEPCFYPHPIPIDAMSCAAVADAARPPDAPPHPW